MSLIDLLITNKNYSYGSDPGTDKESQHFYVTSFYDKAFAPYKDKKVNVLEIGINTGGSLLLWKDYFINGKIHGVDVNKRLTRPEDTYKNITMFFENGYTSSFVDKLPGLDVVIDDGPHTLQSQIECIKLFYPKLKNNGLIVIEDIPDIRYINELEKIVSDYNYNAVTKVIDTREKYDQFDNIIFAIWKQ